MEEEAKYHPLTRFALLAHARKNAESIQYVSAVIESTSSPECVATMLLELISRSMAGWPVVAVCLYFPLTITKVSKYPGIALTLSVYK